MGDAADDAFDSAMRRYEDGMALMEQVNQQCEAPHDPKPCELVHGDDLNEAADYFVCVICEKRFYL